MRFSRAVSAILFTLGSACADAPEANLTSPAPPRAPRFTFVTPCNAVTGTRVRSEIDALFRDYPAPNYDLSHAKQRWALVEGACLSSPSDAADAMMAYVQFTIDVFEGGRIQGTPAGTPASSVVGHWNSTFAYVGYDPPNLGAEVLGAEGAVGVVPAGISEDQEIRAANAALTMRPQISSGDPRGDPRGHLFAISPISTPGCLGAINLQQNGPCFEFSSFPRANPRFSPGVIVGVCQPAVAIVGRRPALGHLSGAALEVPEQADYPIFCSFSASLAPAFSWNNGISGVARRVGWFAKKLLSPQPLYAVHGGLGGVGESLSPFGGVDLMVFEASLSNQNLGAMPGSPIAGSWSSQITKPGKIYTQLGLGNYRDTIIVINQAGGNCGPKCGGIMLQANLADAGSAGAAGATSGRYDISWVSVQDKPVVKAAPFILRGAGGEIAKLEYRTNSGRQELYYNDRRVGNWIRQVPQRFVIRVDFASTLRKTSLWFGALDATPNFATSVPFLNNAATNLTQLAADFRGADSGVMGWAEIAVQRIPDR